MRLQNQNMLEHILKMSWQQLKITIYLDETFKAITDSKVQKLKNKTKQGKQPTNMILKLYQSKKRAKLYPK